MNNRQAAAVSSAVLLLIAGFLVLLDQYLVYGVWFQITDVHHETVVLSLFALAIGLIVGVASCRNSK